MVRAQIVKGLVEDLGLALGGSGQVDLTSGVAKILMNLCLNSQLRPLESSDVFRCSQGFRSGVSPAKAPRPEKEENWLWITFFPNFASLRLGGRNIELFNYFFCFSAFASASSKIASTGFISVHSTWLSRSR